MLPLLPQPTFPHRTTRRLSGCTPGGRRAIRAILFVCVASVAVFSVAPAQVAGAVTPEPIYWRQNLLTVPYQWSGGANGSAPKTVWLYVSKDRGATWNQISDAQPQILAFNYRAEADGEYWFAIRTLDSRGQDLRLAPVSGSAAAMEPELRVVVDTTMPKFDGLTGTLYGDGTLDVRWRVADLNLHANSCQVEVQQDAAGDWRPVPLVSALETSPSVWDGSASTQFKSGERPTAVRATVVDLAGNRALYQSAVTDATTRDIQNRRRDQASAGSTLSDAPFDAAPGWVSGSAPSSASLALEGPAQSQVWPTDRSASSLRVASEIDNPSSGPAISYGTPLGVTAGSPLSPPPIGAVGGIPTPQTDDQPLGNVPAQHDQPFTSLSPFRQVSTTHSVAADDIDVPITSSADSAMPPTPRPAIKLVNSRTFALEYELAEVDGNGVSRVELWGTPDDGQTWRSYAVDDDNRSPISVTVDGEGNYGFRIVVENAGGVSGFPPQPGDQPELLVEVDLEPPQAQITAVDVDPHSSVRQLVVHWEAGDDNLAPRPISLFYSSRPAGPWTAIATSLENASEYRWQLERYVPRWIYLKLEARDLAGNVSAYQSTEPIAVESEPTVARIQRLPPVDDSTGPLP
jgi:hypothetical protein